MGHIQEKVELRLSRELFRDCVVGAVGIIVCGVALSLVSVYLYSLNIGMGHPFSVAPICVSVIMGTVLFALAKTWCVRLLPEGVEVRCLFVRQRWTWRDFQDAEAGHDEIYFPQLSLWKRSLYLGFAEGDGFERTWTILLGHVRPKEKWNEPIALWNGPFRKLTLMHGGVRLRRLLMEQDFSWDDVDRAVVFQPGVAQRGFSRLKIVLQGRVYQWEKFRRLRGKSKSPADYDVVDFLAAHLRKEKLILCQASSQAITLEEVGERKKMAAKARLYGTLSGLGMAALILFACGKELYLAAADWRSMQGYIVLVVMVVGLLILAAILYVGVGIVHWWEWREVEEQLDKDARSIAVGMRGENHKEG